MKLVCKTDKFVIYDEVLPTDQFNLVWQYAQRENYSTPLSSGNWLKVWRLNDGQCLGTKTYDQSDKPFNNALDALLPLFIEIAKMNPEIITPWQDFALRTYLYPQGTKLSWHDDSRVYTGALTYYIHPKWSASWGGELMVAEVPKVIEAPVNGPHLDQEWEDEHLSAIGVGQWILPKPNRLVIMKSGVMHSINRVDITAGNNARCAIVGFFKKDAKETS